MIGEFSPSPPLWERIRNLQERILFMATASKTTGTPFSGGDPMATPAQYPAPPHGGDAEPDGDTVARYHCRGPMPNIGL